MLLPLLFLIQSRCAFVLSLRKCLIYNLIVYRIKYIPLGINKILSIANIIKSCNRKRDTIWIRDFTFDFCYNGFCIVKYKP